MLNSVIFMYIYRERMEKQQRGEFPVLAWQLGTPIYIPAVNRETSPVFFGGVTVFEKMLPHTVTQGIGIFRLRTD